MLEFEFNGYNSEEFGVIIASIEENDQLESRSLILGEKNKFRPRENHFGTTYEENLSFNIVLIKNPCKKSILPYLEATEAITEKSKNTLIYDMISNNMVIDNGILKFPKNYTANLSNGVLTTEAEDYFTSNDIKALNAWLTSPQFPKKLKFLNNEYYKEDIEFFVTFTDISTENIGKPFKLICTATCDSPYGYSSLQTEKITSNTVESTGIKLNDLNKTKYLYNMTDCRSEYVYPTIEIEPVKPNEQITICNLSDNPLKELTITPKTIDSIYIDCERLKIYKFDNYKNEVQITFDDLGISDPNDILKIYWPRLVYGQNIIWTNGLAFITIQWREPRKVGAFV